MRSSLSRCKRDKRCIFNVEMLSTFWLHSRQNIGCGKVIKLKCEWKRKKEEKSKFKLLELMNYRKWAQRAYLQFTQIIKFVAVHLHEFTVRIEVTLSFQCVVHGKYCTIAVQWICFRWNVIGWIWKIWIPFECGVICFNALTWPFQ